jgi:hypothetical protein
MARIILVLRRPPVNVGRRNDDIPSALDRGEEEAERSKGSGVVFGPRVNKMDSGPAENDSRPPLGGPAHNALGSDEFDFTEARSARGAGSSLRSAPSGGLHRTRAVAVCRRRSPWQAV